MNPPTPPPPPPSVSLSLFPSLSLPPSLPPPPSPDDGCLHVPPAGVGGRGAGPAGARHPGESQAAHRTPCLRHQGDIQATHGGERGGGRGKRAGSRGRRLAAISHAYRVSAADGWQDLHHYSSVHTVLLRSLEVLIAGAAQDSVRNTVLRRSPYDGNGLSAIPRGGRWTRRLRTASFVSFSSRALSATACSPATLNRQRWRPRWTPSARNEGLAPLPFPAASQGTSHDKLLWFQRTSTVLSHELSVSKLRHFTC